MYSISGLQTILLCRYFYNYNTKVSTWEKPHELKVRKCSNFSLRHSFLLSRDLFGFPHCVKNVVFLPFAGGFLSPPFPSGPGCKPEATASGLWLGQAQKGRTSLYLNPFAPGRNYRSGEKTAVTIARFWKDIKWRRVLLSLYLGYLLYELHLLAIM